MKWLTFVFCVFIAAAAFGCGSGEEQADDIRDAGQAPATNTPEQATGTPAQVESTPRPTAAPTSSPTPAPKQPVVAESGFTTYTDSSGNIIGLWAAILQNPNEKQPIGDTKITALFFGADNVLLKTDVDYVSLLLPGQLTAAGASYVALTAKPARIEIRVEQGRVLEALERPVSFTVSDIAYVPDRFSAKITAKVSNPIAKDVSDLSIVCMMVASDGSYAAIGNTYLELLPAGTTGVTSCSFDSRLGVPAGSTPRVFVAFSSITSIAD